VPSPTLLAVPSPTLLAVPSPTLLAVPSPTVLPAVPELQLRREVSKEGPPPHPNMPRQP